MRPFRDYTIPFLSLLSGKRIAKSFVFLFGEQRIEDLNVPYYAVSSDLIMAETVVHRSGLLWKAVRASGSVAGVFPPVAGEGRLLIDGGVLDNLPVDVMHEVCGGGVVMAVDVNPYGCVTFWQCPPYGESLGAFRWIRRAFSSKTKGKIPGIQAILERATTLASVNQTARALGKLSMYLRPPTDKFGFLEAKSIDTIADLGYQFAKPDLEAWMETRRVTPGGLVQT
jgi:predicted acylesterase/phospholipase RssA